MQTRKMSLLETCVSTGIGFAVAMLTQILVFPLFDLQVKLHENFLIACIFTAVSIIRGYYVRRFFNWIHLPRCKNCRAIKPCYRCIQEAQ